MRQKSTAKAEKRHAAENVEPFVAGSSRSVGERLRNAREDLGLELRQVSEILRIRYVHLRALEEGDVAELPGQTYALGFVRTYADYLSLDSREMVERYKEEMSGIPRSNQLVFPTPKPEGKIPGGALVLVSLLLVGLAYGGWYAFNEYGDELDSLIMREAPPPAAEAPDAVAPTTDAPVADAPVADAPVADAPASDGPATESPATGAPATGTPTADTSASGTPSAEAPAAATAPATPSAPAPSAETSAETSAPATTPAPGAAEVVPPAGDTTAGLQEEAEAEEVPPEDGLPVAESAREVAPAGEPLRESVPSIPAAPAASGEAPAVSSPRQTVADAPAAPSGEAVRDLAPQPAVEPQPQAAREPTPQTTVAREEAIPVPPIPQSDGAGSSGRSSRVFGTANTDARIVLRATADSWVQVRNARSDLLFTQVLRAGDSYNVPNEPGLTLLTGNAGGLEVLVDGQAAPSLGPNGAVRRDIELEPGSLLQGSQ